MVDMVTEVWIKAKIRDIIKDELNADVISKNRMVNRIFDEVIEKKENV